MANLSITAAEVHLVRANADQILTLPMGETGTGGQYMRLNTTTGKLEHGNGTTTGELGNTWGILIDSVGLSDAGTIALTGAIIDVGDALSALAMDDPVYIGDTDSTLSTTAGTVSRVVARVIPGFGSVTADKLLRIV